MTQSDRAATTGGVNQSNEAVAGQAPLASLDPHVPAHLELVGPPQAPSADGAPPTPTTVLLIGAHPDDAEFSSGGTMAKWVAAGVHAVYVVVTSGDKGTPDKTMTNERLANTREQEQVAAAREAGVE